MSRVPVRRTVLWVNRRSNYMPMIMRIRVKRWFRVLCPPRVWQVASYVVRKGAVVCRRPERVSAGAEAGRAACEPALDVYWSEDFADVLDSWGEGNAWDEIRFLLAGRTGRVLDVACEPGKTMSLLFDLPGLVANGCDISDLLTIGRLSATLLNIVCKSATWRL